jgi:hypothetical protein
VPYPARVRSLRHAAALLGAAHSIDTLLPIAAELSFDPIALPLDATTRAALGIPDEAGETHLVRGRGALRALIVCTGRTEPLRALFTRLASALSTRAGSVLWVLLGASAGGEVGVACWTRGGRAPRLVALVARRDQVVASDAEALAALAASPGDDDLLTHTRWCELLGREALSRRFYRTLEQCVGGLASSLPRLPPEDRGELALLAASRLLFLAFLETKGWLDGDRAFLARQFDACMTRGGGFHERVLLPLWFGTLNTPLRRRARAARAFGSVPFLNGGLFGKTALERRHTGARLSDESLGRFLGEVLGAYRFTAREEHERWSETAIDPEMLGRAFESLMASPERRTSGAFYTPQVLVAHVAEAALASRLGDGRLSNAIVEAALRGDTLAPSDASGLRAELASLTVLDPACGSGAFLVHLLERIADLHRLAGDARPLAEVRRDVLARAIHGVDVNPTAVWLCELRLWLSVVIESDERRMSAVPPLPNLDCNVRVGDALAGDAFSTPPSLVGPPAALAALRLRYARATGPRKTTLRRALEREERRRGIAAIDRQLVALRAERRERVLALRSVDLFGSRGGAATLRRGDSLALRRRAAALRREREQIASGGALPFAFASHFGHVHARGGFGLVVGNPPWVRLHNIPAATRASLRERYAVFRHACWTAGAERAGAGAGFGAQVDLAALFVERSVALVATGGVVALLVPAKLWRSLAGGGTRSLLSRDVRLLQLEDWSEAPCAFDAAVYPSMLLAANTEPKPTDEMHAAVRRTSLDVVWCTRPTSIRFDPRDPASPWLLLPPEVRAAFDRLAARGHPLGSCGLGRPTLGVKCGCNEAFVVEVVGQTGDDALVTHDERSGQIERALLRPLVRGEMIVPWRLPPTSTAIVWTHDSHRAPLEALPRGAARWLAPWRARLSERSDLHGARAWWSLFRTEGADCERTRVVWCDFGRTPRAAVLPAGDPTVPLNSCYVLACENPDDALAVTALLNSPLTAAWLGAIAEPARGGWHRYLAWTVALLPLPHDWPRARSLLAPIAERAILHDPPSAPALLDAVCGAYRLKPTDVAPLLAWSHRS